MASFGASRERALDSTMNTPTAPIRIRRATRADLMPLRLPATAIHPRRPRQPQPAMAAHDFLVPNPRPDLSTDPATLRMIEAW